MGGQRLVAVGVLGKEVISGAMHIVGRDPWYNPVKEAIGNER